MPLFFRDYRRFAGRRLWLALVLMLLGALAEGFGLLMIVPLASIAINGGDSTLFRFAPGLARWSGDQRFLAALALFVGGNGSPFSTSVRSRRAAERPSNGI